MPVHFVTGNMFDRRADVRVNTVNCVGVMGKGVALAFKRKYPAMFAEYRQQCAEGRLRPGVLHVWRGSDVVVVNLPTKRHWAEGSRYDDVSAGLAELRRYVDWVVVLMAERGPLQVTLPALGCGHGGLDWDRVRLLIEASLAGTSADVWVYSPEDSRRLG